MNRGLIEKTIRETWVTTLVFGLGLAGFEILLTLIRPDLFDRFPTMLESRFVQTMMRAFMGPQIADALGPEMVLSFAWVHPVVLALVWGHIITICTRLPAREIESGSIDILLGWPVSRLQIFLSNMLVCMAAGALVLLAALVSNIAASWLIDPRFRTPWDMLLKIIINLEGLYAAVAGLTLWISAVSSHRGRAVGVAFGLLITSFLLNFLVQIWPPVEKIAFLNILNYYRPLNILQEGVWPIRDLGVLLGLGLISGIGAAVVFIRRNIRTN